MIKQINYIWPDLESHWLHDASVIQRLACDWLRREEMEERRSPSLSCCRLQGGHRSSQQVKWAVNQTADILGSPVLMNDGVLESSEPEILCSGRRMWQTRRLRQSWNSSALHVWAANSISVFVCVCVCCLFICLFAAVGCSSVLKCFHRFLARFLAFVNVSRRCEEV